MQTLADVLRQKGLEPPPSDLEDLDLNDLVKFARQCEAEAASLHALQREPPIQEPSFPGLSGTLSTLSF
jgi:hypothetical protein